MITRVWGEINGVGSVPIIALKDTYYFSPPQTLTGRYICQFWAEDDYGNVGYNSAILYIEDGVIKCIEVLSRDWSITMIGDPITSGMDCVGFDISLLKSYKAEEIADEWDVIMVPIACRRDMLEVL